MKLPKLLVLLPILWVLGACASNPSPYMKIGMAYNVDDQSDWYLRSDRDWECSNKENFHAEIGLEFDHQITVGYHHQSHLTCGGPFNNHPELYQDEIIIEKKWGGRK